MALYGCDCYAYGLLAAGFTDLVIEASMQPYDYLALVPVVEGAGGTMTDWKVRAPTCPSDIDLIDIAHAMRYSAHIDTHMDQC